MTNRRTSAPRGLRSLNRRLGILSISAAGLAACCGLACPSSAFAQPTPPAATTPAQTDAQVLDDFMHFVRIRNDELAKSLGRQLLDKKMSNADFYKLVEASGDVARFNDTVQRAMRVHDLEGIAASLGKAYESGRREHVRSADEIAANIKELSGTLRGKMLARQRLVAAGEYAMPQLFEAFLDKRNSPLQAEVQRVIIDMGRQAIIPLATALPKLTPAQQEQVVDLLGLIPWRNSLPFVSDLAGSTKSDNVKKACERAIDRLGGTGGMTTAELYRQLAEGYYEEKNELTSFGAEDFQLLWSFEPSVGLVMTAIRTPVYHEAMTMRLAERAMQLETGVNPDTLALWIAANYSREIDTPAGYINPAYPVAGAAATGATPRRPADYFAAAAGPGIDQLVLARAIDTRDTQLARRAIGAIQKTAGSKLLAPASGARSPLVEAMSYPNRRVQYDAALAVVASQPQAAFSGSERTVPTLASALRGATALTAVVLAGDAEQYQGARQVLEKLGYTVLPQGRTLTDLAQPIAEAPAVDVIVALGVSADRAPQVLEEVRGTMKTSATPVLMVVRADAYIDLSRRYESTQGVSIRSTGVGSEEVSKSVQALVMAASGGPVSDSEARDYAARSIEALRDLAISGNPVLNVGDAAPTLMAALADASGQVKLELADILARVNQDRAQRAVMDAALSAKDSAERIELMRSVGISAKKFGNMLEPRHVKRVLEIATKGSDEEATAAASLAGALGVQNDQLLDLVLKN